MVRERLSRAVAGISALSVALTVAACGGDAGEGSGGVLRVWALEDGIVNKVEEASLDRFNDTDSATARLETFGNDPYKDRLRTALGSGNPPDVFFNWGGGNLKEYVDADAVHDITPLLENNPELKDAFIPSVLDVGKIGDKYYGVPMRGTQPVVLYYNKKLFDDAGVQPPETYADLLDLVDTFKQEGVTPISLAGSQAWTELMWAEYLLDRTAGPEVFQAIRDGEGDGWKHPAVLESLTKLKELVDRGAFGKDFESVGYDEGGSSALLAQGKAAMHLMGSWEYTNQLNESPDFVKNGDLGWVPFPAIEGGKGDASNVVGNPANLYSISARSDNTEAAEKFLSTQMHSQEYVDELIEIGDVPVVTGIEDKLAKTDNSEHATWLYELVLDAESFQLSWDQDLPSAEATKMLEQLAALFLGEQTPEGFVDTMAGQ